MKIWLSMVFMLILPVISLAQAQQEKQVMQSARLLKADSSPKNITLSWQLPENTKVLRTRLYRQQVSKKAPKPGMRATADFGELLATLDSEETRYVDEYVEPGVRYSYRIRLFGEGNVASAYSLPALATLKDMEPPAAPTHLQARVVDRSVIHFNWQASASPDVESYRLYRSYGKADPVVVRRVKAGGKKLQLEYRPAANTQTAFNYQMAAVDVAGNVSPLSASVAVRMPDDVPPRLPQQLRVTQQADRVHLSWMENQEDDLAGYRVFRQTLDGSGKAINDFVVLNASLIKQTSYDDQDVAVNQSYRYRVLAADRFGNQSRPGRGKLLRVSDQGWVVPVPQRLSIKTVRGKPYLRWQLVAKGYDNLAGVMVERNDGNGFRAVSDLISAGQFADNQAASNLAYQYRLRAYSRNGKTSDYSNTVVWRGKR